MNADNKGNWFSLLWRLGIAFALFLVGAAVVLATGPFGLPYGCVFFLMGALLLVRPIGSLIAEQFVNPFWPKRYYDKPQPLYGIPQSRRAQGHLEEAIFAYEQIARTHPDEVRPYLEMIDIAILDLKDGDRAQAIYTEGIQRLHKPESQELLATTYAETRTRLEPRRFHAPISLRKENQPG